MFKALLHNLSRNLGQTVPSECAVCRQWQTDAVCQACTQRFSAPCFRCRTCALALVSDLQQCGECIKNPPPLDTCLAAVSYEFPWSNLVAEFKFHDMTAWSRFMGARMRQVAGLTQLLQAADAIVPMPLSRERLAQRGYNQSLLLAQMLAQGPARALLATPIWPNTLLRMQDTPPQSAQNRAQRLRNLEGTLVVDPLQTASVQGQNMLLVDDVMTTGASLYTAANALLAAGAAQVSAVVFARTE